ncbi:alpha/beta hydrolase fold [Candidatus Moduliflexus flocculans]|uniref:Alpha/beta hydrolase fold n=1 Tax=Candidatus Moduliflexus flocculans TaxID=1499966 RepID=A0A081BLX5_9BACT|nr:alpha/beta hydrolase fold [Candidatus Moduliflexus flocculans]
MISYTTGSVMANGLRFSYIEQGEGELILCLHGFPDHALSFQQQLQDFSRQGYRVVAPYMRGYAPTEVPQGGSFQTAVLGQDAIALIEALGYKTAVVIGHDWGAAAAYAASVIAPEKIRKLIAVGTPRGGAFRSALIDNPQQMQRSWYMFYFQTMMATMGLECNNYALIDELYRSWSPTWRNGAAHIAGVKETLKQPGVTAAAVQHYRHLFNPSAHLPELASLQQQLANVKIAVPTLYIHGEKDGCLGVELTEGMETLFGSEFRKVVIPETGHFVHLEQPETFNRIVLEFLQ